MHEHDLNWVRDTLKRINSSTLRKRRESFIDALTATSFAFSGGENSAEHIKNYIYSLMTEEEVSDAEDAEDTADSAEAKERSDAIFEQFIKPMMDRQAAAREAGTPDEVGNVVSVSIGGNT